jgi:hypothetical protein
MELQHEPAILSQRRCSVVEYVLASVQKALREAARKL